MVPSEGYKQYTEYSMDGIKAFGHRAFSSLRIKNYRLYFIGQSISLSGTWMQTVAQGWLILQLTNSGVHLGSIVALQFLPLLLFGPWGGLAADTWNKRRVLIAAQSALGLLALTLGILVLTDMIEVWMLYMLALGLGVARVFDDPARHAFVSELVDDEHVKNAVSLNATANNLARAVGPSLGGLFIAGVGVAFCFLFNAASYLATITTLLLMRERELRIHHPHKAVATLRDGFRYIRQESRIGMILIMMAIIGTLAYEFQVSLPLLAERTFNQGASGYAILMAVMGLGAVLGGLFAASRHRFSPQHLLWFALVLGIAIIITSLMPSLLLATVGMFVVGFFSINMNTLANTMLQLQSAAHMRGRVMSFWTMAMMGSTPIGGLIIGFIGEYAGARWALGVGGAAVLLAVCFVGPQLLKGARAQSIPENIQVRIETAEAEDPKLI